MSAASFIVLLVASACPVGAWTRDQSAVDEVVREVEQLAADGVVEVTLLGQNVNSYGRDLTRRGPLSPTSSCGRRRGRQSRVRYTSPHPKDLRPDTIDAMACTPHVSSTCTCRCSREATACLRRCTGATPPSDTCRSWPRRTPPSTISR